MLKKKILSLVAAAAMALALTACGSAAAASGSSANSIKSVDASSSNTSSNVTMENSGKLSIVCTNFPEYDFVHQIVGDKANVKMLLKPGAEAHSYEPTPQDILTIQNSNLFVYVGGDSDEWVANILSSMDQSKMTIFKLMDAVDLVKEELVKGMQPEKEEESSNGDKDAEKGPEMDEHVWTSPANAIVIVQKLSDTLCKLDSKNADTYKTNTENYLVKLKKLDNEFKDVVANGKRKEIIVGDRFPFRYFCEEYGLKYYAAFPGCSTDTEANPATVAFLIKKVKEDKIPVVFHIELSNKQMCNSICEATGARSELLDAVHNVSDKQFKDGISYVDLMEGNVRTLKEALN